MLESFINVIKNTGGYELNNKKRGKKYFLLVLYQLFFFFFLCTSLFFPVVQVDTRFITGISSGYLYYMIALTGNRTILPVCITWSNSEK